MKNFIKVLLTITCLLYSLFVVIIERISGQKRWGSFSVSHSINEAKYVNSFVGEYKIQSIPDSVKRVLEELKLLAIINTMDIWVEKEYAYKRSYLYFNKIEYQSENHLVCLNPRGLLEKVDSTISIKIIQGKYPDFGLYRDISDKYVQLSSNTSFHTLETINLKNTIPEILDVGIYFKNVKFNTEDRICGKIRLKLKYRNIDTIHTDKRSLWNRITYK